MIDGVKVLKDIKNLEGKRVLLRLDLNVPILNRKVENDFRIKKSLPTIKFLKERGAKVIILSHIWIHESETLKPVYEYLKNIIDIKFVEDCVGELPQKAIDRMKNGDVIILENLRKYKEEKENNPEFTEKLAILGDIYVNDAFSSSHREHSSTVGLPELMPSYAGLLFEEEVEGLSQVKNPDHPFLFILGGAKFDTKIPLIFKYLDIADYVYVAGALANDFFKAKGYKVGQSLVSDKDYGIEKYLDRENLFLPRDVTVRDNNSEIFVKHPENIKDNDHVYDIGVEAMIELKDLVQKSEFILWNGPLGDYEQGFRDGTIDLAKVISKSSAKSIVGGGDTLAVISKVGIEDDFNFISTAGGALLEFLYSGTLVGIEALKESN